MSGIGLLIPSPEAERAILGNINLDSVPSRRGKAFAQVCACACECVCSCSACGSCGVCACACACDCEGGD